MRFYRKSWFDRTLLIPDIARLENVLLKGRATRIMTSSINLIADVDRLIIDLELLVFLKERLVTLYLCLLLFAKVVFLIFELLIH